MKKLLALLLVMTMVLSIGITFAGAETVGTGKTVGIAMPTQSSERWINDGANMKTQLEALGYEVILHCI